MSLYKVNEGTTFVYKATIVDENGAAIILTDITTLTLTLYDLDAGSIINTRNAQNVLNLNGVTVHATSGLLTWTATPTDNAIVTASTPTGNYETHVALFQWTWNSGAKAGKHEMQVAVKQLLKTP